MPVPSARVLVRMNTSQSAILHCNDDALSRLFREPEALNICSVGIEKKWTSLVIFSGF
jgi:hypothetical protein